MKGVIPAAGLGTRMLPATKSQPKEMLPVAKKPVIQYIVEELVEAGIKEILIITGKNKRAIEDHFDKDPVLLEDLQKKNHVLQLRDLEKLEKLDVQIFYVRQAIPTGLADAVYCAKRFTNGEEFIVALGDTIIDSKDNPIHLERIIDFHHESNAICTLSAERIPIEISERYGILNPEPFNKNQNNGKYLVKDLIEKPKPKHSPSNLAICGRYVFKPTIFDYIENISIGKGGEKQLTDAIKASLVDNVVAALELHDTEKRYDIGSFPLYAKAFVDMCLRDEEIGPELMEYLKTIF